MALHGTELTRANILGQAVLANEKARALHVRDAEMARAGMEATKKNGLAERDVADRKTKADRRALHTSARKLAVPDVATCTLWRRVATSRVSTG